MDWNVDWTIITWDADLRWRGSDWSYHTFRGAKWTDVKKPERRQYMKNAYRVLLTQARRSAHVGFVAEASPPT